MCSFFGRSAVTRFQIRAISAVAKLLVCQEGMYVHLYSPRNIVAHKQTKTATDKNTTNENLTIIADLTV